MREGFEPAVAALWASLGLGRPQLDAQERAVLNVDGRRITLSPSPDRLHAVIATPIGPLAPDLHRREQQMRALLRDGLGMLLGNRAGLQLAREADGARSVEAVAVAPCRAAGVERLRELIEDVVHLAEIHAPTIGSGRFARQEARRMEPLDTDGSLIFRL